MDLLAPKISIIIPVLNEELYIKEVLLTIQRNATSLQISEIIVVDGGSTDQSVLFAQNCGALVIVSEKGRAKQMNLGASKATGEILYFLHVDSLPPKGFDHKILEAYSNGYSVGCFQMRFKSESAFLHFFGWCTKINHQLCRGGDQSLFITSSLFQKANGYNERYFIYEDNEFIQRIYKLTRFKIISAKVETSARRYEKIGMLKLQWHFAVIHLKHYLGSSPEKLLSYYKKYAAV